MNMAHNSYILLILRVQYLDFNLQAQGSAVYQCCKHRAYFRCWRWLWTKTPPPCKVTDKLLVDVCAHEQENVFHYSLIHWFNMNWFQCTIIRKMFKHFSIHYILQTGSHGVYSQSALNRSNWCSWNWSVTKLKDQFDMISLVSSRGAGRQIG